MGSIGELTRALSSPPAARLMPRSTHSALSCICLWSWVRRFLLPTQATSAHWVWSWCRLLAGAEWEGSKITLRGTGSTVGSPGLSGRVRAKAGQVEWSDAKRAVRRPLRVSECVGRGVIGKGRWAETSSWQERLEQCDR